LGRDRSAQPSNQADHAVEANLSYENKSLPDNVRQDEYWFSQFSG
jgi:hypothetical protein